MVQGEVQASPFLFRGGRIIDPTDGSDATGDLLIDEGRIVARGAHVSAPQGVRVIDATGLVVCPGFIDLHTHLRFPGFTAKETIESGTAAAAAGGFTTVCAMANTDPVVDDVDVLAHVLETGRKKAQVHMRQLAAVTYGLGGERLTDFSSLAAAGAVAFSDDGKPVWNAEIMRAALRASASLGKAVSVHEEDPEMVAGGVANAGPVAKRLGLPEWPCSAEAGMAARDMALLEETGGHVHVAHVSCADTVSVIREARLRGLQVTAEVTPHHLLLTDRLLDGDESLGLSAAHPCTKVNPPLRSAEDVDVMVQALSDGTIDAVATDHAPHTHKDKAPPYRAAAFGFSSIEMALPMLLTLVRAGRLTLPVMIERLTIGPARVFGLEVSLEPGAIADICVFHPEEEWMVTSDVLRSKGKNTPLLGTTVRGKVHWTVVAGKIVHDP